MSVFSLGLGLPPRSWSGASECGLGGEWFTLLSLGFPILEEGENQYLPRRLNVFKDERQFQKVLHI